MAPGDRPLVLGLTGGVASGKSTVGRLLAGPEGRVIAADALVHELLDSPEGRAWVAETFGQGALGPDGLPDRAALARIVFDPVAGSEKRSLLEDWTHPRVRARILAGLRRARDEGTPRVVLDVPLLLENDEQHGLVAECDALIFVDVDDEIREERARKTRGWPAGERARREASQWPLSEKRARADHVLLNNASVEDLERAVARLLTQLA